MGSRYKSFPATHPMRFPCGFHARPSGGVMTRTAYIVYAVRVMTPPLGRAWQPQGNRIGWVAGNDLYLEPMASYQVAQALAGNERIPVSEQALRHRLRECGLLASLDAG